MNLIGKGAQILRGEITALIHPSTDGQVVLRAGARKHFLGVGDIDAIRDKVRGGATLEAIMEYRHNGMMRALWRRGNVYTVQPGPGKHTLWYRYCATKYERAATMWDREGESAPPAEKIYPGGGDGYIPAMFQVTGLSVTPVGDLNQRQLWDAGYVARGHFFANMILEYGIDLRNDQSHPVVVVGFRLIVWDIMEFEHRWPGKGE